MKKNIFIIGGSLRKKSYNKFLASNLVEIGKDDFNFTVQWIYVRKARGIFKWR